MKKFEVKAKSAVQLIRSDGIILKPTDDAVILDVDTETDQMEELVRARETGLITFEEVKEVKKSAPKEIPKMKKPKVEPKVDEAKTEEPPDSEDEGAKDSAREKETADEKAEEE